jgi:hypothetical protein
VSEYLPRPGMALSSPDGAAAPALGYVRMSTGTDGASRLDVAAMEGFVAASLGGEAAPIWMRKAAGRPAELWFTVLPVGWTGEWHESPAAQWVTALSGRWWIETADGQRVEMGPGEIHWGADQQTRDGRGHRSGQAGAIPTVQMMVRFLPEGSNGPDPGALA